MQCRKHPLLIISLLLNIFLLGVLAVHWKYIGLKYQFVQTPPLSCYQVGAGYLTAHEDIFTRSEVTKEQEISGATPTAEQLQAFRQAVFVQDTAQEIERLCNQPIGDYTKSPQQ
jgi:uncharacterized membrane protein